MHNVHLPIGLLSLTLLWACAPTWGAAGGEELSRRAADEAFWSADPRLDEALESRGRTAVAAEVASALTAALDDPLDDEGHLAAVEAIRWAPLLGDVGSVPALEKLATSGRGERDPARHYHTAYLARWAAFRLETAGFPAGERAEKLIALRHGGDEVARLFSEDRLLEMGTEALPALLEHARATLFPRVAELEGEMETLEDLAFTDLFLFDTSFVSYLVETAGGRERIEALLDDSTPGARVFAEEVLAGLLTPDGRSRR